MTKIVSAAGVLLVCLCPVTALAQTALFNYYDCLLGDPPTLFLWVESVDSASGVAQLNGVEIGTVTQPFTWIWGDGVTYDGMFPQSHTYTDLTRNYVVSVVSHYTDGTVDTAQTLVRLAKPMCEPGDIPSYMPVTIPSEMPELGTRLYGIPTTILPFDESFFTGISRSTLENILTLAAVAEMDFTNDGPYFYNSIFEEVFLRDSSFGGAYTIWYSDPVAFAAGDGYLQGSIGYSSLFHEMGHNFTLNTPAHFYYGGRTDGPGNMIYSETMAQIYQHAAGWALLNAARRYNLDDDLVFEIKESVTSSMAIVRGQYDDYISAGMPFATWNDPPQDAAMQTFMTVAFKFCEHAETSGWGYRAPLKRMMHLLQQFDQYIMDKFDQSHNTLAADTARSTLLVAAVSYAFNGDLRSEFATLNFPIDDEFYELLISNAGWMNSVPVLAHLIADTAVTECSLPYELDLEGIPIFFDPDGDPLGYWGENLDPGIAAVTLDGTTLQVTGLSPGTAKIVVSADDWNDGTETTAFLVRVDSCACMCWCHGDPKCDGVTNVYDVVFAVGVAFRGEADIPDPKAQCPVMTTDVDCDSVTKIFDIVKMINVAFRNGNPATEFSDPCAP